MIHGRSTITPLLLTALLSAAVLTTGCASNGPPPATQPLELTDEEQGHPQYWFEQPGVARATAPQFDELWQAAERTVRNRRFEIDRADQRQAVITTRPLESKTLFELWRNDVADVQGQAQSTLGSIRRVVRLEFDRLADGTYAVTPKVVVERYATEGRRVTMAVNYADAFSPPESAWDWDNREGTYPPVYWYAVGRDAALERDLAREIERRVSRQ